MNVQRAAVSVFGLGYVGCVSAVCLAERGHQVIGVDANAQKTRLISEGVSPVVENRIAELTAGVVADGRLTVADDAATAVAASDLSLVCVGTPSMQNGGLSTVALERASAEIGSAIGHKDGWHVVVFRSTMVPGTCETLLIPILERTSGKRVGVDFGVCINPEFLREGSSIWDFENPPKTVIGESDQRSGDLVMSLYDGLPGPRYRVPIAVGEMTKYVDNSFHAIKVSFGNEIGSICAALGLDSHEVMEIFLADTKLNISEAYLRPGFAFGGSCLPKDVRALTYTARQLNVDVPLLANVLNSNDAHLRRALNLILDCGERKVGILGLAFKNGTDDLRESPMVELAERLIGKGHDVLIYDSNVSMARLIGSNRAYIDDRLPHLAEVLTDDIQSVIDHGDVVVVGTNERRAVEAINRCEDVKVVVDLVRLPDAAVRRHDPLYLGLGW